MAGYRTHLTCSSLAGAALGSWAHWGCHESLSLSVLAGCLCSVGGILPDIDSKNSTAFQRVMSLVSGFTALMLVSRLRDFAMTAETVVVIGGTAFLVSWYLLGGVIKKMTRHRGMCHSIPMALIAGEIIFLLSSGPASDRLFKAIAMFIGVLVHLILDEFYSVQVTGEKGPYIKKSFGTALKIIDFENKKASFAFLGILILLTDAALNEPVWTEPLIQSQEEQVDVSKKRTVDLVRQTCPTQFELAIVEWVAENRLVLEPGQPGNRKWAELETLLNSGQTPAELAESGEAAGPVSPVYHSVSASSLQKLIQTSNGQTSLLDQINWNSRNTPQDSGEDSPTDTPKTNADGQPIEAGARKSGSILDSWQNTARAYSEFVGLRLGSDHSSEQPKR